MYKSKSRMKISAITVINWRNPAGLALHSADSEHESSRERLDSRNLEKMQRRYSLPNTVILEIFVSD